MLSYHNDPAVKQKFVARFAAHRAADEVIQGTGFDGSRGCFAGCTLDGYEHDRFPVELGWPEWLAHLAEAIFEGIPKSDAAQFGTDLLEAVPVGVDLGPVRWQLAIWRHTKQFESLKSNREPYARQCEAALTQVLEYCQLMLTDGASEAVESAARSAARTAAESAQSAALSAWSAAAESAWIAAESAAGSAWSARSAARSAAWSVARSAKSATWIAERDMLLTLIRALEPAQEQGQ